MLIASIGTCDRIQNILDELDRKIFEQNSLPYNIIASNNKKSNSNNHAVYRLLLVFKHILREAFKYTTLQLQNCDRSSSPSIRSTIFRNDLSAIHVQNEHTQSKLR